MSKLTSDEKMFAKLNFAKHYGYSFNIVEGLSELKYRAYAYMYGMKAFERGIPCIPAKDHNLCKVLSSKPGTNVKRLKEWHRGWAEANVNSKRI